MKLLVVEDEARMSDLLRKGLAEEGHVVTCASDGAEGFALAKSYDFDVVILDLMLPKLTGYEVARRLRAEKVATPRSLIESVWGFDREIEENTLDAFMHLLRNKIDPPGRAKLIHTVRGVGYVIRSDGQA